jgi:hypothetical protein
MANKILHKNKRITKTQLDLGRVLAEVETQAQELFGDSEDCTDDEAGIIFNDSLTHAEKITALKVLRRKVGA